MSFSEAPIFIVGPGRSGTTLMRKMISTHSRISITPETHFMKRVDKRGDMNGSPNDFDAFWEEYITSIRFTYLDIDPDYCLELIDKSGDRSFKNIFRAVITAYKEKSGKAREGEKSPSHLRYLPHLLNWFPRARIIIMQRDPRAVVASKLGTPWVQDRITRSSIREGIFTNGRRKELIYGADVWVNRFEEIVPQWENDKRIYVVSYEKLCHNPEKELRKICQFLGEEFEIEMLTNRNKNSEPKPTANPQNERVVRWKKHHKNTEKPITTDSLDKWKKNLSNLEIALVEARCRKQMIERGYTLSTSTFTGFVSYILFKASKTASFCEDKTRNVYRWARGKFT